MAEQREAAAFFRAIAANAEVMAMKIERGQYWPGDAKNAIGQIGQLLREAEGVLGDDR